MRSTYSVTLATFRTTVSLRILLVQLGQGNQEVGFGGSVMFLAIYPYAQDMSDYPHKATSTPGSHLDDHFCCE